MDDLLLREEGRFPSDSFRKFLMNLAHNSQLSILRTKQCLYAFYWWPRMNVEVDV